jgi:hypothetical protein
MDFKIGKTCNGCDRILKNIKKINTGSSVSDKVEDAIGGEVAKSDVADYLKQTSADSKGTSKQLVKKMNENAKIKKSRK